LKLANFIYKIDNNEFIFRSYWSDDEFNGRLRPSAQPSPQAQTVVYERREQREEELLEEEHRGDRGVLVYENPRYRTASRRRY
jgi:hypothetical protein